MGECNYKIKNPGKVFKMNGVFGDRLFCENLDCSSQGQQYKDFCGEGVPFGVCEAEEKNNLIGSLVQANIDYKQNSNPPLQHLEHPHRAM